MQLLANRLPSGYFGGSSVGAVTPYERELVSLPRDQDEPVDLLSLLPDREKDRVAHFEEQMLLSEEERGGVLEKGLEGDMYVDPLLAEDKNLPMLVCCPCCPFVSSFCFWRSVFSQSTFLIQGRGSMNILLRLSFLSCFVPVVPHKAVAEVSE